MAGGVHNLGAMKINYTAGSADFKKETKKAKGQLEGFVDSATKKFKQFGNAIRKALSVKNIGIGVGGLLGTLGLLHNKTVKYSSDLVEASRVAGMGVVQFEKLREVLKGDGIGFSEAEAATRRFAKRIGELRLMDRGSFFKGIESIAEKFPDLAGNLFATIKDESKTPIDILQAMVDLATKAKLGAEEIAALFDLGLGLQGRKMGITLLNAAKENDGDIKKAMEEYGKFLTMSAEEHIQNKGTGQQFTEIATNLSDAVRKVMSTMSEPLERLIKQFNDWLLELKKDPEVMGKWVESFKKIFEYAEKTIKAIATIVQTIADAIDKWNSFWSNGNSEGANRIDELRNNQQQRNTPAPKAPSKTGARRGSVAEDASASTYSSVSDQIYTRIAASSMVAGIGGMSTLQAAPFPDWMTGGKTAKSSITPAKAYAPSAPAVSASASVDVTSALADLRPTVDELNSSFRTMINAMIDGTGSFRGVLNSLLDSIMQRAIVDPIADRAASGLDAFFGGLFGGGKARGGRARGLTLVGERGPEVVDFNNPAQIYSNDQLRRSLAGGAAGGSPTIIYNIQSSDGPGVRAALAEATPNIISAANAQMMEETNRVGATRRIMQGGF